MIAKNRILFLAISKIFYALVSEIDSITENTDKSVSVTFEGSNDWKEIYATKGSAVFSERHKIVDEGDLFEQSVEFGFPGDGLETQNQITDLLRQQFVMKLHFANCSEPQFKLLGSVDNPCIFSPSFKSGNYETVRQFIFSRESESQAPFLSVS